MNQQVIAEAGSRFHKSIMDIGATKAGRRPEDILAAVQPILESFKREAELENVSVEYKFCDVHELMRRKWHTELAYVEISSGRIKLSFHYILLKHEEPHAGMIFLAKSWVILIVLDRLLRSHPEIEREFVFEMGDGSTLNQVCFTSPHPKSCKIMDYDFAVSNGYWHFRKFCETGLTELPNRIPKIFWRGSTTGVRRYAPALDDERQFEWLQRLQLASLCRQGPLAEFFDVGITRIVQISEEWIVKRIASANLSEEPVPRESFAEYQGVFDVDGNANAWSGLFCSLLGGSCVLKVASPIGHRQWYYDRLVPWKNYIPIDADLRDLEEAVNWWRTHPSHVAEIAARGQELARRLDFDSAIQGSVKNLTIWLEAGGSAKEISNT
jgi:hypothetical protein